jgi:hypothetical protein
MRGQIWHVLTNFVGFVVYTPTAKNTTSHKRLAIRQVDGELDGDDDEWFSVPASLLDDPAVVEQLVQFQRRSSDDPLPLQYVCAALAVCGGGCNDVITTTRQGHDDEQAFVEARPRQPGCDC